MKIQLKLITLLAVLCLSGCGSDEKTVYCDDKEVGSEFQRNGQTYLVVDNDTARSEENLQKLFDGSIRYCTSHVTNTSFIFYGVYDFRSIPTKYMEKIKANEKEILTFNQPIDDWDVSKVTDMAFMLSWTASFNQPLNNWNVSSVINMTGMFIDAQSFNQPLDSWDVSNVEDMEFMFDGATAFKQSLDSWAKKPELPNQ